VCCAALVGQVTISATPNKSRNPIPSRTPQTTNNKHGATHPKITNEAQEDANRLSKLSPQETKVRRTSSNMRHLRATQRVLPMGFEDLVSRGACPNSRREASFDEEGEMRD
jgi:hypothetical protein